VHELAVTQSILQVALEHAAEAGAQRIECINLRVGDLSGVVGESVQFYFDFISRGTAAEGAELVLERVPARFRCRACGMEYEPLPEEAGRPGLSWTCPACGELLPEVIGGREMFVDSIEVE
jgi:hydrogenase nickel incorporation protein HypA/HybF